MAFIGPYQQYTIDGTAPVARVQDWVKLATAINSGLATAKSEAVEDAAMYTDSREAAAIIASNTYTDGKGFTPAWKADTAYPAGFRVVSPNGDIVSAKVAFTSGATYNAANWNSSVQDGRLAAVETQNADQETRIPKRTETGNALNMHDLMGQIAAAITQRGTVMVGPTEFAPLPESSDYALFARDLAGQVPFGLLDGGGVEVAGIKFKPLPASSPYSMLIRDRAGQIGQSILANGGGGAGGSNSVSELHAFIIGGQSNMSGRGTPYGAEYDPVDSRILQYGSRLNTTGKITTATVPLDMHDAPGGLSPATVFAREYLKTQPANVGVLLIPAAHGGTGFYTSSETPLPAGYVTPNAGGGTWQYNRSEPVNLYQLMVAQTTAALAAAPAQYGIPASLKGFLWHQGEGDTTQTDQAGYAGHFDALVTDLRSRFGATLPVVLGGMSPDWIGAVANRLAIRAAHVDTPRRLTRSAFVKATPDTGKYQDEIHFGRAGVEFLGAGYAEAYKRALANITTSNPMSPRNTRATFIGGTLTAEWDYPISRVTSFVVEYSIDGGAWTTITRALPMDFKETKTGLTGSVAQVRVSTVNEVGTSAPSTPTTALGA